MGDFQQIIALSINNTNMIFISGVLIISMASFFVNNSNSLMRDMKPNYWYIVKTAVFLLFALIQLIGIKSEFLYFDF